MTPVIEAQDLTKHFQAKRGLLDGSQGVVRAVDGISFAIEPGRTLGVVGESGCGKTTTAKLVLGLEEPTGGQMRFEGRDLRTLDRAGRRNYRRSVQAVFQDPYASLNPRMRINPRVRKKEMRARNGEGAIFMPIAPNTPLLSWKPCSMRPENIN